MHKYSTLLKMALDKGLFHLLGSNFLVQFLGFGLILFLAKYLSQDEIGILKLIHSYAAFFILLGCFGYNSSVLKFCSENISTDQKIACFNLGLKRAIFFSLVSFVLMLMFNQFFFIPERSDVGPWPNFYALIILFAPPAFIFMMYMQSQKEVVLAAKLQAIVRVFFVFLIFLAAVFFGFEGVIISTVLSYIVGLVVYFPYIKKDLTFKYQFQRVKEFDWYSILITIGSLVTVVAQHIDIYLLGFFGVSNEKIGVYAIAVIFFLSGTVITGTVQTVITPYFSEKQENLTWVKEKANFYQKRLIVFSLPISVGLILCSYILINFYFGPAYNDAFFISCILVLKYFIWSWFCVYGAVLFSIGVVKEGIYIICAALLSNIIISFVLFPIFDVIGIALAQVFAAAVQFLLVYLVFRMKVRTAVE